MRIRKVKSCKTHKCEQCHETIKDWEDHMLLDDVQKKTPIIDITIRTHLDCWEWAQR